MNTGGIGGKLYKFWQIPHTNQIPQEYLEEEELL